MHKHSDRATTLAVNGNIEGIKDAGKSSSSTTKLNWPLSTSGGLLRSKTHTFIQHQTSSRDV